MVSQLSTDGEALRLFFTEDIYFVNELIDSPVMLNEEPQSAFESTFVEEMTEFKYLGKNKRNILILVNDDQHDVSDETGRELLRKIVKSVNLTADDFALLNYAKHNKSSFEQLMRYFKSTMVFSFGVSTSDLAMTVHPENSIVFEGSVKLIFSAHLPRLNEDAQAKKALWGCLQNLGL